MFLQCSFLMFRARPQKLITCLDWRGIRLITLALVKGALTSIFQIKNSIDANQSGNSFQCACFLANHSYFRFLSIGHSIFLYSCKMYIQLTFDCFKHLCKECWATSPCIRHNYNLKILSVMDAWNIETNNIMLEMQIVESIYKISRIGNLCVLCWQGVSQLSEGSDVHGDLVQDWYNLHNANSRII